VRNGEYLDALTDLDAIDEIGADDLPRGEVAFLRGSVYFGLSDYATARSHLEKAEPQIRGRDDPEAKDILPVLLFQLGASRFFLGQDEPAVSTLSAYIALDVKTDYDPFAYQLLLQALVNRGERTKAQEVLARAKARFAGTRYEAEFKTLPGGP
jgi:tetratricopeptide (TPR) repeat protein